MDDPGEHEMEPSKGQFLLYEAEDGQIKIDVRLEGETVWLTQRLMAELFQKDVRTVSHHIQSIYEEGELSTEATIRKYRIVQTEGKREVVRMVDYHQVERDDKPAVEFSWIGEDGRHPRTGRGWAVLEGDELKGRFFFHQGDDSAFTAKRVAGRA